MKDKMRAIVLREPGVSQLVDDYPTPKINDDEVLVQIMATGMCATDVKLYKGQYSGNLPVVPGHEFAGKVAAVGSRVTNIKLNDSVVADPNESCGVCRECRNARSTFCTDMAAYGVFTDGGFAEYAKTKEKGLYVIPDGVEWKTAAFVEPISCALHGIERAGIRNGDTVVIIGAGTMGQLLLQVARTSGASMLIHIDRIAWKLNISKEYGATHVIDGSVTDPIKAVNELTGGLGADVVIEAVGQPSVLEEATKMVGKGGTIVQFGFPAEGARAEIEPFIILQKEIKIVGSWINPYTYDRALRLLADGTLRVDHLITHVLKLEDYEKGIHLIEDHPMGFMKSIFVME
ncbi:MAG: zinc-dependent alcohol dehydrogenase family protein [Synergistaceae bacterium]|jgi:threonine dehydrogenase-like Zn-dependent dehydrogenase|nr:zinc-dependent alcohol dehydrogenase family protein [Synergistaceae bacterium]